MGISLTKNHISNRQFQTPAILHLFAAKFLDFVEEGKIHRVSLDDLGVRMLRPFIIALRLTQASNLEPLVQVVPDCVP